MTDTTKTLRKAVSARRAQSRVPLTADEVALLVPMLRDIFANRTGLLETRKYGRGQRNPSTLPSKSDAKTESVHDNRAASQNWRQLRGWANSIASVGAKY